MNADPRVMESLPKVLDRPESDALAARIEVDFELHGFGLWAVEVPGVASFIDFVGLSVPSFEAHFTPCVDVGCRLAFDHRGRGYATEAARAALRFGFEELALSGIVSFTVPENRRSRAVMERLGMTRDPAYDLLHTALPEGYPSGPSRAEPGSKGRVTSSAQHRSLWRASPVRVRMDIPHPRWPQAGGSRTKTILGADLRAASLGRGTYPCTPSLPLRPAASPYPRVSTHAGRSVSAGGEPLDVLEAMELLSGMKRQNGQGTRPGQELP
jgi:RimJ/RimL family protein N-acetyltransferase